MYLKRMKKVTRSKTKPKHGGGDYDMYAVRLAGDDGKTYLSMLLAGSPPGQYTEGAVDKFMELREKYGEAIEF
eukprot:gene20431-27219_t